MAQQVNNAGAWAQICRLLVGNSTTAYVDQFGHPTTNISNAWGVTVEECNEKCGQDMLTQVLFAQFILFINISIDLLYVPELTVSRYLT